MFTLFETALNTDAVLLLVEFVPKNGSLVSRSGLVVVEVELVSVFSITTAGLVFAVVLADAPAMS